MSELRWNPLLGEWIATASHRQDRTFLPPKDFCPLCPTQPGGFPTEIPDSTYDIVVFENKFPSLRRDPPAPAVEGTDLCPTLPSRGICEVVVYTPHHAGSLAHEPVEQIDKLIRVWTDRYVELGALEYVDYVFIFENKGEAIGVTLHHPHGQIYGYPFIPPIVERELSNSLRHHERTGSCLVCDVLASEQTEGRRVIASSSLFVAYAPFFSRYPYEVHIVPKRHLHSLAEMSREEQRSFAETLKTIIQAYDLLFDVSFPYMMVIHQRPTDGGDHSHYHFHLELLPLMRAAGKLKYLAGSESGAGMFITDILPEDAATRLRELVVPVRWTHQPND